MTFLEHLLKRWLPSSRVEVRLGHDGGRELRVRYSDHDWAYYADSAGVGTVELARELIPERRGKRRRLHWGRCRPRSGVLRLEMRGRFGATPSPLGDKFVANTLGAP